MANILGFEFDPTPNFNLTGRIGSGIPFVESEAAHREYDIDQAVKKNPKTYTINGVTYNAAGDVVSRAPVAAAAPQATASAASYVDPMVAQQAARIAQLRGDIQGKRGAIENAYRLLFGDLNNLAKSRASEVEKNAGENINKLTSQYTESIPGIESSYASLGSGDSTDTRDAKIKAKTGFDESVAEVGKNKKADLAAIGNYVNENTAKFNADKNSIMRLIDRVNQTENEGDLNEARNNVENKLDTLAAERGTLGTDEGARGTLSKITSDNGRFASIQNSLDSIINSSLSGGVKQAAVQAVADSADLTPDEKAKIKLQYGNVYNEPTAA